jgi:hypothetical protein
MRVPKPGELWYLAGGSGFAICVDGMAGPNMVWLRGNAKHIPAHSNRTDFGTAGTFVATIDWSLIHQALKKELL